MLLHISLKVQEVEALVLQPLGNRPDQPPFHLDVGGQEPAPCCRESGRIAYRSCILAERDMSITLSKIVMQTAHILPVQVTSH